MKAIIAGGRNYCMTASDLRYLDSLDLDLVIVGGARGADANAKAWARARGIQVKVFVADWEQHGKAAGPIRNRQMAACLKRQEGDVAVVLFPGGRGTASMRNAAQSAGLRVLEPHEETRP